MKTKIYTKGGDFGETSIIGGARVSKSTPQLEAYGDVDELNSVIGLCLGHLKETLDKAESSDSSSTESKSLHSVMQTLTLVQNELFAVGSQLASENEDLRQKMPQLKEAALYDLEVAIDKMTEELPELKEFILPGGCVAAAQLHFARTVCRRAERAMVAWITPEMKLQPLIRYINRLSDYLFVSARYVNNKTHHSEIKWKK